MMFRSAGPGRPPLTVTIACYRLAALIFTMGANLFVMSEQSAPGRIPKETAVAGVC